VTRAPPLVDTVDMNSPASDEPASAVLVVAAGADAKPADHARPGDSPKNPLSPCRPATASLSNRFVSFRSNREHVRGIRGGRLLTIAALIADHARGLEMVVA